MTKNNEQQTAVLVDMNKIKRAKRVANHRTVFNDEKLKKLAKNIEENGLISPIVVRDVGIHFELVAGERRYRACTMLGWEKVPAIVKKLTDRQTADIMMSENLEREDVNALDEARSYSDYMTRFSVGLDGMKQFGSPAWIERRILLNNLIEDARQMVINGNLRVSKRVGENKKEAELIAVLPPEKQRLALAKMAKHDMSLTKLRRYIKEISVETDQIALFRLDDLWDKQLEKDANYIITGNKATIPEWLPTDDYGHLPAIVKFDDQGKDYKPGEMIYTFIIDLENAGKVDEALAVSKIYTTLVKSRLSTLPRDLDSMRKLENFQSDD